MPGPLTLENFGGPSRQQSRQAQEQAATSEEQLLQAFDKGYRAGWDDAVKAKIQEQAHISDELANTLGDLSFTFNEARTHILAQLEPILRQMAARMLPEIAEKTLGPIVAETVLSLSKTAIDTPAEVVVHPENRVAIEAALPKLDDFPMRVREEPALSAGQALIKFGTLEKAVDLQSAVVEIEQAVEAFFYPQEEERQHA